MPIGYIYMPIGHANMPLGHNYNMPMEVTYMQIRHTYVPYIPAFLSWRKKMNMRETISIGKKVHPYRELCMPIRQTIDALRSK
jgi:hypothetical protein